MMCCTPTLRWLVVLTLPPRLSLSSQRATGLSALAPAQRAGAPRLWALSPSRQEREGFTEDQIKRKQLAEEIQMVALDEVTYVPWGEWVQPTGILGCRAAGAHRDICNVSGK